MSDKRKITDAEYEIVHDPRPKRLPFYRRPIPLPFGIYLAMEPVVQWAFLAVIILLPIAGWATTAADMPLNLKR